MFRTPLALFRTFAIAEVVSWTLLIAGLILRAATGWALGVTIGGGVHGFVFLAYAATALVVAIHQRWSFPVAVVSIAAAIVPYATLPVELWLHRSGRLAGAWRLEAGGDPRDQRWIDRLIRWFLRRPWMLGLIVLTGVVVVFSVLLFVGPPGGRE